MSVQDAADDSCPEEYKILREMNSIVINKNTSDLQIMQMEKHLHSKYTLVRVNCLKLIGQMVKPNRFPCGNSSTFDVIKLYIQDNDARVREAAFGLYLQWFNRGFILSYFSSIFDLLLNGLNDREEQVVITCLKLVTKMAMVRPDLKISSLKLSRHQRPSRFADLGYSCVASTMFHLSSNVRREAASLLGEIRFVSEILMLQTLEKVVMEDRTIKKPIIDECNSINRIFWIDELLNNTSEKSQGLMLPIYTAEDAMTIGGINGALICGLEDDIHDIRLATIKTIGKLSIQSEKFALFCQDLLIDMLTDQNETVRANSMSSLIIASGKKPNKTLRIDQLDIVLSVLFEKNSDMRRSIHQLLCTWELDSSEDFKHVVQGLFRSLSKYMMDYDSISRCAIMVAKNHPEYVQLNLKWLLSQNSIYQFQNESKNEARNLITALIVMSASHKIYGARTIFPDSSSNGETSMSDIVTLIFDSGDEDDQPFTKHIKLDVGPPGSTCLYSNPDVSLVDFNTSFLESINLLDKSAIMSRAKPPPIPPSTTDGLIRLKALDLQQNGVFRNDISGTCLWWRDLVKILKLIKKAPVLFYHLKECQLLAYKMIFAYAGVPRGNADCLRSFIEFVEEKIETQPSETDEIVCKHPSISDLESLVTLPRSKSRTSSSKLTLFSSCRLTQVSAKLLLPRPYDEEKFVHRLCAGKSLSLQVRAEFSGLDAIIDENQCINVRTPIAVIVKYPNDVSFTWQPPSHCWSIYKHIAHSCKNLLSNVMFLDTKVPLSFINWSRPGFIHVGLAILFPKKDLTWKLTDPVDVKINPIIS